MRNQNVNDKKIKMYNCRVIVSFLATDLKYALVIKFAKCLVGINASLAHYDTGFLLFGISRDSNHTAWRQYGAFQRGHTKINRESFLHYMRFIL